MCTEQSKSQLNPTRKPDCFNPNKMAYPLCVGNPKTSEECETCDFYEEIEEGGHER